VHGVVASANMLAANKDVGHCALPCHAIQSVQDLLLLHDAVKLHHRSINVELLKQGLYLGTEAVCQQTQKITILAWNTLHNHMHYCK